MLEPCGWDATPCKDCCTSALDSLGPEVQQVLADMAVGLLWSYTGRRFGLCETVLRPCRRDCGSFWGGLPTPTRLDGAWVNLTCGTCRGGCGCSTLSEFIASDVAEIVAVDVDGEALDPLTDVIVYDRRRIVRADGGVWPTCQNLSAPAGADGTWSVTVLQGTPVPAGGEVMAGILLCELAKACTNDDGCRLPRRVQNIARQGVSVSFFDMFAALGEGRTGLYEVDLWIGAANSTAGASASISSLDLPRASVQTWPGPEST